MTFTRIREYHHIIIANIIRERGLFSRGTKDFIVSVSNSENGPWTEFKNGTLEDSVPYCSQEYGVQYCKKPCDRNPILEFDANQVTGRYVQFRCLTHWGRWGCALHYIEVY